MAYLPVPIYKNQNDEQENEYYSQNNILTPNDKNEKNSEICLYLIPIIVINKCEYIFLVIVIS